MLKSYNGPRSSFSLLPFEIQYKIISLLQDGATFATISKDAEIAAAYQSRGVKLTPPAISRLKQSEQYKEWTKQRLKERSSFTADRLTTAFLKENASLDTIAEQTKVALLKALSDLSDVSDLPDESRVKALRNIAGSVTALSNQQKDRKITELADDITALKKEIADLNAAHEAEIARLVEQQSGSIEKGVSEETLRKVEQNIKLL